MENGWSELSGWMFLGAPQAIHGCLRAATAVIGQIVFDSAAAATRDVTVLVPIGSSVQSSDATKNSVWTSRIGLACGVIRCGCTVEAYPMHN